MRNVTPRHELIVKIQSLPLVLEIALFQSLPKILDPKWGLIQAIETLAALRCLKLPFCDHKSIKLTHQSVYQSPCSAFCHTWIPLQGPWVSRPATVYCRLLATTLPWVSGETIIRSSKCYFWFTFFRTQHKTDQVYAKGRVHRMQALLNRPQRAKRLILQLQNFWNLNLEKENL